MVTGIIALHIRSLNMFRFCTCPMSHAVISPEEFTEDESLEVEILTQKTDLAEIPPMHFSGSLSFVFVPYKIRL